MLNRVQKLSDKLKALDVKPEELAWTMVEYAIIRFCARRGLQLDQLEKSGISGDAKNITEDRGKLVRHYEIFALLTSGDLQFFVTCICLQEFQKNRWQGVHVRMSFMNNDGTIQEACELPVLPRFSCGIEESEATEYGLIRPDKVH